MRHICRPINHIATRFVSSALPRNANCLQSRRIRRDRSARVRGIPSVVGVVGSVYYTLAIRKTHVCCWLGVRLLLLSSNLRVRRLLKSVVTNTHATTTKTRIQTRIQTVVAETRLRQLHANPTPTPLKFE